MQVFSGLHSLWRGPFSTVRISWLQPKFSRRLCTAAAEENNLPRWGSLVVVQQPNGRRHLLTLRPGKDFRTHFGVFTHEELRRAVFGSSLKKQNKVLKVYQATYIDYIETMKRHITPMYPKDVAATVMLLDIECGSRVLEIGTGTGGCTIQLCRTVGKEWQEFLK